MSMDSISDDKIIAVFDNYSGLIITKLMKAKNSVVKAIEDILAIALVTKSVICG